MTDRFEGIIAQLKEEETTLRQRQAELNAQLRTIDADIARAQEAIAVLGAKSPTKKSGGRQLGPTREQVTSLVSEVLQTLGALDRDALHSKVEQRLKDKGLSRVGFTARFKEALGDQRFCQSPAGWKLVSANKLDCPDNDPAMASQ